MITKKLKKVKEALLNVPCNLFHYYADKEPDQYIVWAENGGGEPFYANNQMVEQVIVGTIDYFTKTDLDPNIDAIQHELKSANISFSLESVQYEEETGYIHYEWKFEVV